MSSNGLWISSLFSSSSLLPLTGSRRLRAHGISRIEKYFYVFAPNGIEIGPHGRPNRRKTTPTDYRGGWRTDQGEAHTYEFSIRGDTVRGIYCTYYADATTLAFVDGKYGPDGMNFVVTHLIVSGVSGARAAASSSAR